MSSKRKNGGAEIKTTGSAPPVTPPPAAVEPQQMSQEFVKLLGEVCWLMSRATHRRYAFMADLDWLVMPALVLGQARLYRNDKGDPIAFVSWATVSDEVDARLKSGVARLAPPDWRSGPHLWIFDIITPFGGAKEMLDTVNKSVFQGKAVSVLPLGGKTLADVLSAD